MQFFEGEKLMKKLSFIITVFIFSAILCVPAFAYNFDGGSLFNIDVPEGFVETEYSDSSYLFENNKGDTLNISFSENTEEFCVKNMREKDFNEYKEAFAEDVETVIDAYEIEIKSEFIACEKVKTNDGTTALMSIIKTTLKKGNRAETYYQKVYEFGGVNNKYTFAFSTTDEKRLNDLDDCLNSIVLNEASFRSTGENIAIYLFIALIVLLCVAGIVRFIRTPEKRRQGKLK